MSRLDSSQTFLFDRILRRPFLSFPLSFQSKDFALKFVGLRWNVVIPYLGVSMISCPWKRVPAYFIMVFRRCFPLVGRISNASSLFICC